MVLSAQANFLLDHGISQLTGERKPLNALILLETLLFFKYF